MNKRKIVAFGDSLTAGSALRAGERNWTDILAQRLNAEVLNRGVGGHTSTQGLARMETDVLRQAPDVVILCFGMNDHVITDAEGNAKTPPEQFRKNLTEMLRRVREIGAVPVLVTPTAVIEVYYFTRHPREWYGEKGANGQLARYCDIIRKVAKEERVALADLFTESQGWDLSELLRTPDNGGFEDGVHPYGRGIDFYAEVILPVLK